MIAAIRESPAESKPWYVRPAVALGLARTTFLTYVFILTRERWQVMRG
jgi:hypothetical protein